MQHLILRLIAVCLASAFVWTSSGRGKEVGFVLADERTIATAEGEIALEAWIEWLPITEDGGWNQPVRGFIKGTVRNGDEVSCWSKEPTFLHAERTDLSLSFLELVWSPSGLLGVTIESSWAAEQDRC